MKIISIQSLSISEIKVIRFARFCDQRGYFTEHFRRSDLKNHLDCKDFMKKVEFLQFNESYSKAGVMRGLHFQWNPFMGKLVRTLYGHMIDIFLDIRKGSPTFGKAAMYDMPISQSQDYSEWIWIPPGFAHGNFFTEDSMIEYLCSGEYSQGCEAGISPLAADIDWSLCDKELKASFARLIENQLIITDKDRNGFNLANWVNDSRSDNFIYGKC